MAKEELDLNRTYRGPNLGNTIRLYNLKKPIYIYNRQNYKEDFDPDRIKKCLIKAGIDPEWDRFMELFLEIIKECENGYYELYDFLSVEVVQDCVERVLIRDKWGLWKEAKAYILARAEREKLRDLSRKCLQFIEDYKESDNTANATIDDNSNVGNKNIAVLNTEMHKQDNVHINRNMVLNKLRKLYPDMDAKQYKRDLESHIIYKHDESTFGGAIAPYCCSISMYPFLTQGLKSVGGQSNAPTNLNAFCGGFINLIFITASQFAGAVATSEFFCYFDYFARKQWGDDYMDCLDDIWTYGWRLRRIMKKEKVLITSLTDLKKYDFLDVDSQQDCATIRGNEIAETPVSRLTEWAHKFGSTDQFELCPIGDGTMTIGKGIRQYFQQVIYSINQPAGSRGMQAPFVNFSYFDKAFFDGMFGDFYFPDGTKACWESTNKLQRYFMKWFNAERLRTVLTFPVESFALVYKDDEFVDKESAELVAEMYSEGHSFFTYISDSVDSLSSCCFEGDEQIEVSINGETTKVSIKDFVDNYKEEDDVKIEGFDMDKLPSEEGTSVEVFEDMVNVTGVLKKNYTGTMYTFIIGDRKIKVTSDHIITYRIGEKYYSETAGRCAAAEKYGHTDKLEFFVNKEWVSVDEIYWEDVENKQVYDIELANLHYFAANGVVTHNCRLKNKLQTKEFNFTNGNMGVMTGSKSVITINMNRITQDFCKEKDFKEFPAEADPHFDINYSRYIKKILDRIYKYHTAYNECLWDCKDAGLYPVYDAGLIDLNKQYLTIGINGLNEAAEFLGIELTDNPKYARFCQLVFSTIKESNTEHSGEYNKHKLIFNTECVPAESLAVKNYNWDKTDGYKVPEDRNLYASYIFQPSKHLGIHEKLRLHGANYIGDFLDGGAAAHLNLKEHLSKDQYKHIMKYAASHGCQYFTINVPNCKCDDCGYIQKTPFEKCPKCGSTHITTYDRIIGYLTATKSWSDPRKLEGKLRDRPDANNAIEEQ